MTPTVLEPHVTDVRNAAQFLEWIRVRGGLALWRSLNLSDLTSWTCPLKDAAGNVKSKPFGHAKNEPYRVITSSDDVLVQPDKEVRRFKIALRVGRQGLSLKLTDGSTAKVRKAVEKAGVGAYYAFDYETQQAIIMAPDGDPQTLTEWAKARAAVTIDAETFEAPHAHPDPK